MLLSRSADNLFWLARYIERADSIARLVQTARRLAMTDSVGAGGRNEWDSVVVIAGGTETFYRDGKTADPSTVADFLVFDAGNPASLAHCLDRAPQNARAERTKFTSAMWETLNATWLPARERLALPATRQDPVAFLEWIRERAMQFRGALDDTMLLDDALCFYKIGANIERANNTARLLDVKYHVLLPEQEDVGGAIDYYQWTAVLRAVSAHRSFHFVYKDDLTPWRIAEFMILRQELPRSLSTCLGAVDRNLALLADMYGERHECHRLVGELHSELKYGQIDRIFEAGLHEYLTEFISRNSALSDEIHRSYLS